MPIDNDNNVDLNKVTDEDINARADEFINKIKNNEIQKDTLPNSGKKFNSKEILDDWEEFCKTDICNYIMNL